MQQQTLDNQRFSEELRQAAFIHDVLRIKSEIEYELARGKKNLFEAFFSTLASANEASLKRNTIPKLHALGRKLHSDKQPKPTLQDEPPF